MANYQTELEALNAIADDIAAIKTSMATANGHLSTMKEYLNASNALQTSANTTMTALRGAVVDVKNVPTDACIIRIYVGDITEKREKASEKITGLLSAGYRPYMVMGISEDLARVLFVKYPAPNDTPLV